MSEALEIRRLKPYTAAELSVKVDSHDLRISTLEEKTAILDKVWRFLKWMTPAMVGGMLASMNPESIGYKFLATFWRIVSQQ